MSRPGRKEDDVRRMLDADVALLPADLADRAVDRGGRRQRRLRVLRVVWWAVLLAVAVGFTVWAVLVQPWEVPPAQTTPEIYYW